MIHAIGRRAVDRVKTLVVRFDSQRTPQRQRVADGAGLSVGRDDDDVADRFELFGQREDSLGVHAVVISDQNSGHENHRS